MDRLWKTACTALLIGGCGDFGASRTNGDAADRESSNVALRNRQAQEGEGQSQALLVAAGGSAALPDALSRNIDTSEAHAVAEQIVAIFRPFASQYHSAKLHLVDDWANTGTPHAQANPGRDWVIFLRGGAAAEGRTRDTMSWVVCHEIGHFFAGFPFHSAAAPLPSIANLGSFPASEGSADYFSTKDCLWRLWANDRSNAAYRAVASPAVRARCDSAWQDKARRDICYRSVVVAAKAIPWIGHGPSVDISTPSTTVVERTIRGHFDEQCRFDTLLAGALCPVTDDPAVIPGLLPSPITGRYGDHSVASEQASKPYACIGQRVGARPTCWFKPDMPEFDCAGFPEFGQCAGDGFDTCRAPDGVTHITCSDAGCVMFDDPDLLITYPICADNPF